MIQKIALYIAAVVLVSMTSGVRVHAQTFKKENPSVVVLAGNGTDVSHTITLQAPALAAGYTLTFPTSSMNGALVNTGGVLSWVNLSTAILNPMTGPGDMIYGGVAGAATRFAATATANQILLSGANAAPAWSTATYPATAGSAGNYLRSDGANFLSSGIQALDVPTLNQNTTGSAAKWTTARNLAGNSVDGSANVPFANKFIVQGTVDAGLSGAQFLGSLATGIVKNTNATGVLSIAIATDFPTLNQNSTGTANVAGGTLGAIPYQSAANTTTVLGATATAKQILMSGASAAPIWSTATYPSATTSNQILYSSANNTITGLATANNGVLITSAAGVPSISITPTLGVAGISTGSLAFANTTGGNLTTIQAGVSAPAVTYTLPASTPVTGQVLTLGTVVGAGPYTAPLTWVTPTTGTVTAVSVASANGFAGASSGGATPALTLSTTVNGMLKGNGTAISAATSGTDYAPGTSALGTGILKSTTASGVLSIAIATDFPTLNQNTTGTANIAGGTVGAIPYQSGAGATTVLGATATANQVMLSGANAAPAWSTATYPATTTINQLMFSSAANTLTGLATANNGVLTTNSSGVPSISITPTLGVAGTSTGSLAFANTTGANLTTIQAGVSAPAVTYTLPTSTPLTGQVLTLGTVVGAGPYTAPLTWATPTTGTVTAVSVASANGFAGASSGGATPALTLSTTVNGMLKGNGTAISAATSGTDYSAGTSALATGILKSTTGTGALTTAIATDFPTLNQNTTGNATTATTATNATNVATTLQTVSALTFYPTFVPSNTTSAGQAADVATGLSYVPSTGTLSATTFSGALSGNATGFTGNLAGDVTGPQGTTAINTTAAAGGHIISALTANAGTLTNNTSGNATTATTATNATNVATTLQTVSALTFYPTFVPSNTTSAGQAADVATGLSYVPSTGTLSATTFSGALSGNATGFTGNLAGDVTGPQGTTAINTTAAAGGHIISALTTNGGAITNSTTGSAAKWTTARNLAGNSVDGSANVAFANKFIVQGTVDAGLSGAQFLGALGTGIVKNTTATGVLSIAIATDFPTLNQNTTGTANIAGGTVGAIPYQSGAGATTVLGATATANQIMLSGANAAPAWSTATYAATSGAAGNYLRSNGTNFLSSAILPADLSGAGVEYGPASTQNTLAAGATKLFDIAYAAAAGANATDAGAAITANASGATNGTATGLTITTTGSGTGTATGLVVNTSGGAAEPSIVLHNVTNSLSEVTTADASLLFEQTGDVYGTSILALQNRNGSNGALFQTIPNAGNPGVNLVDYGFIPGSGVQSNIRLEARTVYLRGSQNQTANVPEEFQYFFGTTTTPEYVLSIGPAATMLEQGNFGIGYYTASTGTAGGAGAPLEKLDVHGLAATASNIILSNTGTAAVNGLPGTLKFQGTRDGISSFIAGAQGSNTYNYTLPITTPTANQVLAATAVSGATPFAVTLGWANAVVNPMTGTGDMIYGGAGGAATRLAAGASNTVLHGNGASAPTFSSVATADIANAAVTQAQIKTKALVALADAPATLTATQMIDDGIFTITPTANRILTTTTAALLVAGMPNAQVGSWFSFTVVDLAAHNITLATGAGVTLTGVVQTTAAGLSSMTFLGIFTNVTGGSEAVTIYRE